MSFPYSVLRAKKEKKIRILDTGEDITESKNIRIDFQNQLDEITKKGLLVDNEDSIFVTNNMHLFYRNNLAVILLTLNIRKHGVDYLKTDSYQQYFNYIARKQLDEEESKNFSSKLNFELKCYDEKIEKILSKR